MMTLGNKTHAIVADGALLRSRFTCRRRRSSPIPDRSGSRRGFTFAELLAAMAFVAIVIPVAVRGLAVANRAGVVAERKRIAVQLADRLLTEKIVTDDWRQGQRQGDFGDEWPGFEWTLVDEAWGEDTILVIRVEVTFEAQGRQYKLSLSTLVDENEDEDTQATTQVE